MRPTGPTHKQQPHAPYDKKIHFYVSEAAEVSYVDQEFEQPWRSRLIRGLHSSNAQFVLGFLLLLDVAFLFTQVFLDAHFPQCYVIQTNAACFVGDDLSTTARVVCNDYSSVLFYAEEALFYGSVSILVVFELELFMLFMALQLQFFRNLGYWLDVFIVTISLVLEVSFHGRVSSDDSSTAATALILARIWRLVRIGHGLFATQRRKIVMGMLADDHMPDHEPWEEDPDVTDGRKSKRRSSATQQTLDTIRPVDSAEQSNP